MVSKPVKYIWIYSTMKGTDIYKMYSVNNNSKLTLTITAKFSEE